MSLFSMITLSDCWTVYWSDEKGESVSCDSVDISVAVATEKVFLKATLDNLHIGTVV